MTVSNVSAQVIAVSTEERCLLYCIQSGDITPVGSKGRQGRYGVSWSRLQNRTNNTSSCCVYSARPGQRVWQADGSTGAVGATLLIKDLPEKCRIFLPGTEDQEQNLPPTLRFEIIVVTDTGQLVMSAPDSLVIFNPDSLLVEAFIYQKNFCCSISSSGGNIFILNKDCKLFCLSSKPADICINAITANSKLSLNEPPLVSPATIEKFKNKFFLRGNSLMENVGRIGGVIASKVSEVARDGNIVNGYFEDLQDNYSRNISGELNTVTKQSIAREQSSLESAAGIMRRNSQDQMYTPPSHQHSTPQHKRSATPQHQRSATPQHQLVAASECQSSHSQHDPLLGSARPIDTRSITSYEQHCPTTRQVSQDCIWVI